MSFDASENDDDQNDDQNPTLDQLRKQIDDLNRDLKRERKEKEGLLSFKQETVQQERQRTVKALVDSGIPEAHLTLFQKLNPEGEITEEAFRAFAEENALSAPAPVEQQTNGQPQPPFYQPTPPGAVPGRGPQMSYEDFRILRDSPDPAKKSQAYAAMKSGLVDVTPPPGW